MRDKIGTICMGLGTVLILAALSLFLLNQIEDWRAGASVEETLPQLLERVGESDPDPYPSAMTEVEIDGYRYIGYLSVPTLELTLPVMSQWSYEGLKIAPGRFSGATFTDDLVICGHNYARHFSPLKWLEAGTEVDFTDMDGVTWRYEVLAVEILRPTQVEEMIGKTQGDEWDLTLFTCTYGGESRAAVRCGRITEDAGS